MPPQARSGDCLGALLRTNSRSIGFVVPLSMVLLASPAAAQVKESLCNSAKAAFPKAAIQIQERLELYARCVSKSDGSEDCRSEFNRLRSEQSSFETITRDIRTYCRT